MNTERFDLVQHIKGKTKHNCLWLCNIGAEKFWNSPVFEIKNNLYINMLNAIEEINLLLCKEKDIILLRRFPDNSYLDYIKNIGFEIPQIIIPTLEDDSLSLSEIILKDEKLHLELCKCKQKKLDLIFVPYAVTSLEEHIANKYSFYYFGASAKLCGQVNDKIYSRYIAEKMGFNVTNGYVCNCYESVEQAAIQLFQQGFKQIVLKDKYGASGKGLFLFKTVKEISFFKNRLFNNKYENPSYLVEGWYSTKHNINYQIHIKNNGIVECFSLSEQLLSGKVYCGSIFPAQITEYQKKQYYKYAQIVGRELYRIGYEGIASIDSIITADDILIPIIEINARFSLSTYTAFLADRLNAMCWCNYYLDIVTKEYLTFQKIYELMDINQLLYSRNSNEGVFLYNTSTISHTNISGKYFSRLFIIIISDNMKKVMELLDSFVKCMKCCI